MHYPINHIPAEFENNRLIKYSIAAKIYYYYRRVQTGRRTDVAYNNSLCMKSYKELSSGHHVDMTTRDIEIYPYRRIV